MSVLSAKGVETGSGIEVALNDALVGCRDFEIFAANLGWLLVAAPLSAQSVGELQRSESLKACVVGSSIHKICTNSEDQKKRLAFRDESW